MDIKEGNLQAPDRQPLDWKTPDFCDQESLYNELERVFDVCHTCRRCVSLCDSFPTLFDLIDDSETFEVDGVNKNDYMKVVDQCFLCDLCAETKCPYLPPHEWGIDFPHLMLRAKAYKFSKGQTKWMDRLITSTDKVFRAISTAGIRHIANRASTISIARKALQKTIGIHAEAPLPNFKRKKFNKDSNKYTETRPCDKTTGKVAVFVTCYGEHNEPSIIEDLVAVFRYNGIEVAIIEDSKCCGMPKLELGDLNKVEKQKDSNLPVFSDFVNRGYDIVAPIPSCVLMFKQELPLMFPEDKEIQKIKNAFFDPFEYLVSRHKAGLIKTDFKEPLGTVAYHSACHQRVQNIGAKTKEFISLIPDTEVTSIDRCSGHDGTYALKAETYDKAMKIARPVVNQIKKANADTFGSDCPMAGRMIAHGEGTDNAEHPISMVRRAYGI
ncbi:MAG: Fe-S oxidoreductase [Gammaproteobacteria bacterium]|nr:Fe-S oxidoreductase [Gammaproteobacteria bacterium]